MPSRPSIWDHPQLRPYRSWPWIRIAVSVVVLIAFNAVAVPLVFAHSPVRQVTMHVDRCAVEGKRGQVCLVSWTDRGRHHQMRVSDDWLRQGTTTQGWVTPSGVTTNPSSVHGYQLGLLGLLNVVAILVLLLLGVLAGAVRNRMRRTPPVTG